MEWSARTFLIYVLRSIRMRNAPVILVVNRLLREEEFGSGSTADVINIISEISSLPFESQMYIAETQSIKFHRMIRGGERID